MEKLELDVQDILHCYIGVDNLLKKLESDLENETDPSEKKELKKQCDNVSKTLSKIDTYCVAKGIITSK